MNSTAREATVEHYAHRGLTVGGLAYYDSVTDGPVPIKVERIYTPAADVCGFPFPTGIPVPIMVDFKVTADHGAYRRGERETGDAAFCWPRQR